MEPSIEHFYGKTVSAVSDTENGWQITFVDGERIVVEDPDYPTPDNSVVGTMLSRATLSNNMTELYFGTDDNPTQTLVVLQPTQYVLVNADGERSNPQGVPEEVKPIGVDDEWADRLQEGPEKSEEGTDG